MSSSSLQIVSTQTSPASRPADASVQTSSKVSSGRPGSTVLKIWLSWKDEEEEKMKPSQSQGEMKTGAEPPPSCCEDAGAPRPPRGGGGRRAGGQLQPWTRPRGWWRGPASSGVEGGGRRGGTGPHRWSCLWRHKPGPGWLLNLLVGPVTWTWNPTWSFSRAQNG